MTEHDDDTLRGILGRTRVIALIGASAKPERPSHQVMEYLIGAGYDVHPVNPGQAGAEILGRVVHASLADVPAPVDLVDVFLRPDRVGAVIDQAIGLKDAKGIRVVWLQEGVRDDAAAARAEAAGLTVVQDRCTKKVARDLDFARAE